MDKGWETRLFDKKPEIKNAFQQKGIKNCSPPPHGNNNNNNNNNNNKIDRTVPNNKPDIIIRDNEKGTCALIDVAISGDRNVIKEEDEKILKYKDLTIEI